MDLNYLLAVFSFVLKFKTLPKTGAKKTIGIAAPRKS